MCSVAMCSVAMCSVAMCSVAMCSVAIATVAMCYCGYCGANTPVCHLDTLVETFRAVYSIQRFVDTVPYSSKHTPLRLAAHVSRKRIWVGTSRVSKRSGARKQHASIARRDSHRVRRRLSHTFLNTRAAHKDEGHQHHRRGPHTRTPGGHRNALASESLFWTLIHSPATDPITIVSSPYHKKPGLRSCDPHIQGERRAWSRIRGRGGLHGDRPHRHDSILKIHVHGHAGERFMRLRGGLGDHHIHLPDERRLR